MGTSDLGSGEQRRAPRGRDILSGWPVGRRCEVHGAWADRGYDRAFVIVERRMATIETISEQRCHGGMQGFYRHASVACGGPMRFALFLPPQAARQPCPLLYFLAGLTCTEETATIKAGAQRLAAELGLALVMPDTSPRDTGFDGATGDWEFGEGAGFYLDATQPPWSSRFRMRSYVAEELPALLAAQFPLDTERAGVCGHSMGGHGALSLALTYPQRYRSVSAFAPIVAPARVPW